MSDPLTIDYFDASALAKRYVEEPETGRVRVLLARSLLATSRITEIEIASALARRCRDGDFSEKERDRALEVLRRDLKSFFLVEVTPAVNRGSSDLLRSHPLRALDALHLASCFELRDQLQMPVRLAAYDRQLVSVARAEGLEILQ